MTTKDLKKFEETCVSIGYNMCRCETITILRNFIKNCDNKSELNMLEDIHDRIMELECVWSE